MAREQQKDGSFMCLMSVKLDDYRDSTPIPAIVPTNIVLSSLVHISESDKVKKIKQKAADFLLGERSAYWSINYWIRKSDWYKKEPFPDDLDDTFCALTALYEYRPGLFDGEAMAKIVTILTSAEKGEGGPYDMWLVPPEGRKTWDLTDLVVNSNIAFFLSLQNVSLPKVNAFIEKCINDENYEFPYNKIYPAIYFISRFYKGKKIKQMVDLLLSKQEADGKWENPLRTALAISALINFSGDSFQARLEKAVAYLLKTQTRDGSWEPFSFYFQMKTPQKTLYAGSSSITTALCLEAINKFTKIKIIIQKSKIKKGGAEKRVYQKIVKNVEDRFTECGADLKQEALKIIAKTLKGDADKQIVLLPYFFRSSLGKPGKNISDDLVVMLGAANLFGWIAYTIYDDFLDEEGDSRFLSVANICLRESAGIFSSVLRDAGFADFSKKIFDVIDSANAWEISNCRINFEELKAKSYKIKADFGDYRQLAEKSLGYILGPMAILFALGYKENSVEARGVMLFFRHYIIARQLNDDAHDWEDDLKRGQVNAVGAKVLKTSKGKVKNHEELRKIFWEKTVVRVCEDILRYVDLARKDLSQLPIMADTKFFTGLLAAIEHSARQALKEREETMKFVRAYK